MSENEKLFAKLDAIEAKLDQVLVFRDQVVKIAGSKFAKLLLGKVS